jgi:hypothetical protein
MTTREMTPSDVNALCDAAQAVGDRASDRTRCVTFTWRGMGYQSTMTSFRMLIHTREGEPVAERYHQW